jgi:hypothetical protein
VGQLAEDEYYAITVAFTHGGEDWFDDTPWRKDAYWYLSDHRYLLDLSDDGLFQWQVQVIQQTGVDEDGNPVIVARSPESEMRELTWKIFPDLTPTKDDPDPATPPPPTP